MVITTASLPNALVGSSYQFALSASGGIPPYTWSVSSGALPGGFLLSSLGTLFGLPSAAGTASISLRVNDTTGLFTTKTLNLTVQAPPPPPEALLGVNAAGSVLALGTAALPLPVTFPQLDPVVAIAGAPSGLGEWLVSAMGTVTAVRVPGYGSVGARSLRGRIVAIAATPNGLGYWLLSSTGRVYSFGAARDRGDARGLTRHLRPVGIASGPNARGYVIALDNGRVEAFGDATDYGGVARRHLAGRIVGITHILGGGYVAVSSTGRIYRFGPAKKLTLPSPRPTGAVAITAAPVGAGFWVLAASGQLFPAGSARPLGSLAAVAPVVALGSMP